MSILSIIVSTNVISALSPQNTALSILAISIITAVTLFNTSISSWIAFVVILTFSSGIIILFVYATSLSPNENTTINKNNKWLALLIAISIISAQQPSSNPNESINTFSSQTSLSLIAVILLITMVAISSHSFHPTQTTSISF